MADAFMGGVKLGGLTSNTEIRILLCYLVKNAGPVTRDVMQGALMQEQLVNYFEFANALAELEKQNLATIAQDGYRITEKGAVVADTLSDDLPRSVRESAIRAVIRIQSWIHKAAQNRAVITQSGDDYKVSCTIGDLGEDLFHLELLMPDALTAAEVKNRFIACGSEIYATLLNSLTAPLSEDDRPPEAVI